MLYNNAMFAPLLTLDVGSFFAAIESSPLPV